jgi:hypothetical protein
MTSLWPRLLHAFLSTAPPVGLPLHYCRVLPHDRTASVAWLHEAAPAQLLLPPSPWAPLVGGTVESPSLVLIINDTKLLMTCVKCFELGISNTCDEGVCGKKCWPQDHKEMVHGHKMTIMVEMHIK